MDSLRIQDVFEPYYAGRKRFARRDRSLTAEADDSEVKKLLLLHRILPDTKPSTETDSTTEH
jgi:hypothetical protein